MARHLPSSAHTHGRRRLLVLGGAAALGGLSLSAARAQSWPARAIRLVVGFPAGSSTDLMARELADGLKNLLGQPVLIDNVPGAGSTIAATRVAHAAPDGYTIYLALLGHILAAFLFDKLPYDSVNDFTAVARVSDTRFLIAVRPRLPADNLREFVALAKASPGKYSYGSSGAGAGNHLMMEMFARQAGIELLHVPYKSATEALNAVLAGDIDMTFFNVPPIVPYLRSGALKTFGVGGPERSPFGPEIPTMAEAGYPGFEASTYNFILAPRGLPAAVLTRLNTAINTVTASGEFRERIKTLGATASPNVTPSDMDAFVRREMAVWGPVVKASGAKAG